MRVHVKGIKRYRDRHGKLRLYHRKSGTPIDATLSGAELAAEVARLDAQHTPKGPKAGTLGGLLESYRKSPRYTGLAARTRADYLKIMDHLKPIEGTPLALTTTGFMAKLRDKTISTKRAGFTNHMLAMLSSAFKHGMEYELVDRNPCAGLSEAKMASDRKRPNRPWTKDERSNVLAAAWEQIKLPLALARYLGVRRGDICALPRSAYRDGFLSFRSQKTGKLMKLPVLGELKLIMEEAIASSPEGDSVLLCLNTRGKPWTANGLSVTLAKFFADCEKRGLCQPGLTLHGLRHSVATDLRSLGYTDDQIKDYLGHDSAQMTAHYSSSADVTGVLIDMANLLQAGPKRERGLTNRRRKSV